MTLTVKHATQTGAAADTTALVDGPAWDASHTLTGTVPPSQGGTGVANNDASTITISGSFGVTFTISADTSLTLPETGTLATLAGAETLSNKTLTTLNIGGKISPSQITANQNNYAPTGLSSASVIRLTSDAARNITGLSAGSDGDIKIIENVGSFNITLKDESASSTAANRFALTADQTLYPDSVVILKYDGTSARWRAAGGGGSTFLDSAFTLQDDGDTTKQAQFQLSGLTTATTRTYTLPDASGTLLYSGGPGSFSSLAYSTTLTGTSSNSNAVAVGPNGSTNPSFQVDASTASAATGIKIKSAAAAAGVAVSVVSSGTNENLTIDSKGSGSVTINGTATGFTTLNNGVSMSLTDQTQSIAYPTFDSTVPSYTTGFAVSTRWTGALTLASAAIAGQATVDSTTTGSSEVQGVYGGAAIKRSGYAGAYGVTGVVNNYSTATTPSGSGLFGIVRGDLATVSGASVTGVTGVRSVSEVVAGQHPNAAYFCYNSVATNAFSVGYYCASAADYGFRVGYGSGSGSNTIMPTYAYALIDTSDVLAFGVAAPSGNVSSIGTISKTAAAGSANTSFDGYISNNTTAATSGNQQYSPRVRLTGQGWKTNATAASQTVDWIVENRPVQNTVTPTTILAFASQLNGGGYNDRLTLNDGGGGGLTVTYNGSGSSQFVMGVSGASTGAIYADATQVIMAATANVPLILKTNNTEVARLGTAGTLTLNTATGGLGYGTGAGGTVTQATSKTTGVTLNKVTGQITMNNAALTGDTTVSFTLTNSAIAAGDLLVLNHVSGGTAGSYLLNAQSASGTASINVRNITTGSLSEAIVIGFAVIKAVTA